VVIILCRAGAASVPFADFGAEDIGLFADSCRDEFDATNRESQAGPNVVPF